MTPSPQRLAARRRGQMGEFLAVCLLRLKGFHILERNLSFGRGRGASEVDIVARRGSLLIFVEVKARPDRDQAAWAISTTQQQRVVRSAELYLARHPDLGGCDVRFDAILLAKGVWPSHIDDAWRVSF